MGKITSGRTSLFTTVFVCMLTVIGSGIWFMSTPQIVKSDVELVYTVTPPLVPEGNYLVIRLDTMNVILRNGTTTLATLPILTTGKPGSYYETIGGSYSNDYKVPLHFSSIGHVYMPHSVHIFGNYFIHGIPYYPNGEKVSSTYSGGCIRLSDENAKTVYDFIENGTPIIVTKNSEFAFKETATTTSTLLSQEVTNLMVATISLETLTQDNSIIDTDNTTETTRRKILTRLITEGDTSVSVRYAESVGTKEFVERMNKKAESLGLTNTNFNDATSSVLTTEEDYKRFMDYIVTYKSYLKSVK